MNMERRNSKSTGGNFCNKIQTKQIKDCSIRLIMKSVNHNKNNRVVPTSTKVGRATATPYEKGLSYCSKVTDPLYEKGRSYCFRVNAYLYKKGRGD